MALEMQMIPLDQEEGSGRQQNRDALVLEGDFGPGPSSPPPSSSGLSPDAKILPAGGFDVLMGDQHVNLKSMARKAGMVLSWLMYLAAVGCAAFTVVVLIFGGKTKVKEFVSEHFELDSMRGSGDARVYLLMFTAWPCLFVAGHLMLRTDNAGAPRFWSRSLAARLWSTWDVPFFGGVAVLEILIMVVWIILQSYTMYVYYAAFKLRITARGASWGTSQIMMAVCRMFGIGFGVNCAVLMIPVSKHAFWLELFDIGFERAVRYHRWLGVLAMLTILLHGLFGVFTYWYNDSLAYCMGWTSTVPEDPYCREFLVKMNIYGQVSIYGGIALSITSLPRIRRWSYQLFYYSHLIGALLFFVFGIIHDTTTLTYLFAGLATYVADKVISIWRRARSVSVLHMSINEDTECIKLELGLHKDTPLPRQGHWFHINVKEASVLQWHPMSVGEVNEENHSVIFYIRQNGNWTRDIGRAVRGATLSATGITVRLDGPFGGSHTRCNSYLANDAAVFICGGVGITAHGLAVDAALQSAAFKYVGMRWFVTRKAFLDQHVAFVEQLAARGADIRVYITRKEEAVDPENYVLQPATTWDFQTERPVRRYLPKIGSPIAKAIVTLVCGYATLRGWIWANTSSSGSGGHSSNMGPERTVMICKMMLVSFFGTVAMALALSIVSFITNLATSRGALPERVARIASTQKLVQPESQYFLEAEPQQLTVTQERPDLDEVFAELASSIKDVSGIKVAGVSLCGPESLVHGAIRSAHKISKEGSVKFIIDEEEYGF
mmetsp:Transcript_19219/g.37700  ORF Transcript_19219/g.37700 Transcript_19219/m.37700 type:complete len:777 (-) Transcript_19219:65-2395(-)|eukprot:CAMPEP_0171524748 /NCGR_PEP_ID=MMETSP0959-20130129/9262_1 /TAXON_ID=87120 /ORGANISM="Aurantiochytrium limacinum, Strain ATCCMYA-1381" /LENGTH=776 /DNA_ID=CAMNT_0012065599 /DNA_START=101 /DNA_END=2431 /DNA_ORIENTATION=+